ncbi:MAG: hypothetical protein LBK99_23295 [Opitutaceae bacterium]|jgi:hypothetical protein|nr:hypothetical protein [Opitutaceae bacterium]
MKNHTGIIKNHLHTRRGGSLWRMLSVFTLAALFETSTGFAAYEIHSAQSGSWFDPATWRESEYVSGSTPYTQINIKHTVTVEAGQSMVEADGSLNVRGHFIIEAGSSFSAVGIGISLVKSDGEIYAGRMTLGSGATVNLLTSEPIALSCTGTVEMAAGSSISMTGGLLGWQNLVFDGNGQDAANAWISTSALIMFPHPNTVEGFSEYTGP